MSVWGAIKPGALCFVSFEISSLAMAETTEAAHLDAREVREPVTPEVTGPVRVPELPPSGDVDVATINAGTDAFINGMVQAVGEEDDPRVKRNFQMCMGGDGETCHVKCSFAVTSFGANE